MALGATIHHFTVSLSDVERDVYTEFELRLARHPSETFRYLMTRTLAYALCWEEGIAFSKAGIASTDEAPLSVRDLTGQLLVWIDIGSPSAERLHKAAKAAPRVVLFSSANPELLRKEAATRAIHRLAEIELYPLEPAFLDRLEPRVGRSAELEILRSDGRLYVTVGGVTEETDLERASLIE
jgi:uncharacterized protein YaeQ